MRPGSMKPGSIVCLLLLSVLCLLPACSGLPLTAPTPAASATLAPAPLPTVAKTLELPTPTAPGPLHLRVWLPPFMAFSGDDPAGSRLRSRLEEFQSRNPNVIIETRTKSETGPGGLFDSLVTASAAAPAALPDLIALPRDVLEAAALKGLLLPYDSLTASLDDPDWYPFARELAYIQDDIYGLPFAGDAMVQVYHIEQITEPLQSWSSVIEVGETLLFPAASEQPFFTLLQYQANGGVVQDEQGRPALSSTELAEVLAFYQNAVQAGVMPEITLTQLQTDAQAWDAFTQTHAAQIVTWTSSYLDRQSPEISLAAVATPHGDAYTLASGWVWALVGRDEQKRRLAVDLAEFLTDSQYLAGWSMAAGYLPARPSALAGWSPEARPPMLSEIANSAHLLPPTDVRASLQAPLGQATIAVLKGQSDPITAAQAAVTSLTAP
ncbi:MAG: hypothetical protein B6D39_09005 [Anaerolineae bacterium UTCFX2]|nr:extracellular solute-binding protein [Anaerolineae bacterium]OQY89906.1 MAG: hypothetical protein B6D39_09005 [Anaerolineae bacterium UTCFX2]